MRLFAVTLSAALLGACVEVSDPCREVTTGTPALELGTGNLAYQAVNNGELLGAHYGPQGGYHVYGSLLASSIYPGSEEEIDRYFNDSGLDNPGLDRLNPFASYSVVDMAGNVVAERKLQEPLLPGDTDASRFGDLVFFKQGTSQTDIEGTVVNFSVTIKDVCGRTLSDEVTSMTLTVQTPPP